MKLEKKAPAADITNLPKPKPAGAGARKAVTLAVLAAVAVGGAAFWLTREHNNYGALVLRIFI